MEITIHPGVLLSFVAAFVPAVIYTLLVWWLDRYEREPWRLMLAAFVWGAAPAILLSVLAELVLGSSLAAVTPGLLREGSGGNLTAPLIEEIAKGAALLALFTLAAREFDSVLDGVVYGAVIGFGFAMTENFLYFIQVTGVDQMAQWTAVVIVRALLFGFNHAFYTAIIGAGFGMAVVAGKSSGRWRWLFPLFGLALATAFHAVHNLGLSLWTASSLALWVAIAADWGGVGVLLIIVLMALEQERRWIAVELQSEVGYTLTLAEYEEASSYGRRLFVWLEAVKRGGWQTARRNRARQHLLTELAFLKRRYHRDGESSRVRRQIAEVRSQIVALDSGQPGQG